MKVIKCESRSKSDIYNKNSIVKCQLKIENKQIKFGASIKN